MKYRATNIFAQKSYTADFTETIDINLADPISEIHLNYQGLNTSGSAGATAHWSKCVTKIELVNGSDVLFSLAGLDVYAHAYLHRKRPPAQWLHYLNDNYFSIGLILPFGRWLWDTELALLPRKFNNLQLKVSSDMDAGGVAPDASKLDIWAMCFDQKEISPKGFLSTKQIKEYTMGDASHEYTDLPTDDIIRKLQIRALVAGTEPNQVLNHIKLDEDNDRHVIIDADADVVGWLFPDENIQIVEGFLFQNDGSQRNYFCTPTSKCQTTANEWAAAASAYFATYDGDGGRVKIDGSAGVNGNCIVNGFYPNATFSIPLGNPMDIDDWFNPEGLKNLRLDLKSASSMTNTCQIILEQLRKY